MSAVTMSLKAIEDLAIARLTAAGASPENAAPVALSLVEAERDGIASHGLMYLPIYVEHLRCGKVVGDAKPVVTRPRPGLVAVDAANGFAHPAIMAGFEEACAAARENGVAALAIRNSYNCGVLGHHAERITKAGFLGLCFTNAPASIAPQGGKKPVIGTNPFALATPDGNGGAHLVIDQSASVIAKSQVIKHANAGQPIPEGWALDADGRPTTDAAAGLKGSMVPSGGYKGFGIGLMVEIFAAALTGSALGTEASPFSGPVGGPPGTGQFFLLIDPSASAGGAFAEKMAVLCETILAQEGTRLPGAKRIGARTEREASGVSVANTTLERINSL